MILVCVWRYNALLPTPNVLQGWLWVVSLTKDYPAMQILSTDQAVLLRLCPMGLTIYSKATLLLSCSMCSARKKVRCFCLAKWPQKTAAKPEPCDQGQALSHLSRAYGSRGFGGAQCPCLRSSSGSAHIFITYSQDPEIRSGVLTYGSCTIMASPRKHFKDDMEYHSLLSPQS